MSADPPFDAIARADAPQLAITPATIGDLVRRPLLALPPEVRAEALVVWTCHKHLKGFESPLSLCAALAVWIGRHGLTPADANLVLGRLLAPGAMGRFAFTSELMTHLAAAADERIAARRREADAAAARDKAAQDAAGAADPAEVAAAMDSLKDLFAPPPEVTR